jgi:hypothetical protein
MPQYEVRQTLTVERLFEVEAEDADEAERIAADLDPSAATDEAVVDDTFVTVEAGVAIP